MSKDEDRKEETEKEESAETKDSSSPGIKVKTLEEILREKALKKLEERRAQNKGGKSEEKENKEEQNLDKSDEGAEEAEEEVSSVVQYENVSSNSQNSNSVDASNEGTITRRKMSSNDEKNWPLKKVISTVSQVSNSGRCSAETPTVTEAVSPNEQETRDASKEPPSPFQEVRVKSFEEIMQLKRKRMAEKEGSKETLENVDEESPASAPEQANNTTALALSPPKRLKRIVGKSSGEGAKESNVVSSSGAESSVNKVQPTRKRTVFVVEKPSPIKQSAENG